MFLSIWLGLDISVGITLISCININNRVCVCVCRHWKKTWLVKRENVKEQEDEVKQKPDTLAVPDSSKTSVLTDQLRLSVHVFISLRVYMFLYI